MALEANNKNNNKVASCHNPDESRKYFDNEVEQ